MGTGQECSKETRAGGKVDDDDDWGARCLESTNKWSADVAGVADKCAVCIVGALCIVLAALEVLHERGLGCLDWQLISA